MCGLVGAFGNLWLDDETAFKQALQADYFRGRDSVGVACIDFNDGVSIFKSIEHPSNFLDMSRVDKAIDSKGCVGFIGHNRAATLGKVNTANAHPFQHEDITLAHNGTLDNKWELERKFKAPAFGTDSELITWLFSRYEPQDIIPELEGAFALTWWNESDKSMNLVRNSERPLSVFLSEKKDTLHWASEGLMLEWILHRNKLGPFYTEKGTKYTRVSSLPIGKLHKFTEGASEIKEEVQEVKLAPKQYTHIGYSKPNSYGSQNYKPPIHKFNSKYGTSLKLEGEVYGWIKEIHEPQYSGSAESKIKVTLCLAVHPFCDVVCWYVPDTEEVRKNLKKPQVFSVEVSSYEDNTKPILYGRSGSFKLVPESEMDEFDKWVSENGGNPVALSDELIEDFLKINDEASEVFDVAPEEKGKGTDLTVVDSRPLVVKGYSRNILTAKVFKDACNNGCCCCGDPIDFDAEMVDRKALVIDHFNNLLCSSCQQDKQLLTHLQLQDSEIRSLRKNQLGE